MRMSEEEAAWISNEYSDCPLFAAVKSFVKEVSIMDGMPAGHPSIVFYLAVYAIDDIKCTDNRECRFACRSGQTPEVSAVLPPGVPGYRHRRVLL